LITVERLDKDTGSQFINPEEALNPMVANLDRRLSALARLAQGLISGQREAVCRPYPLVTRNGKITPPEKHSAPLPRARDCHCSGGFIRPPDPEVEHRATPAGSAGWVSMSHTAQIVGDVLLEPL